MDNIANKVETNIAPYTTITMIYNRGNCISATVEIRTNEKGNYDFEEFIKFTNRESGLEIKTSTYCEHNRLLVYTLQRWN